MFKRLRNRLAMIRDRARRFPPPRLPELGAVPALRRAIETWRAAEPERYAACFLFERAIRTTPSEGPLFEQLASLGLVEPTMAARYGPAVRLFSLDGKLVATDLLGRREPDQVFSLMFEQVYLVRTMDIRPGDRVLELCVGSGVNSLFAADTAASVVGVDLNERALAFARFNRRLNGADERIELRQGSLFDPVGDDRFDVVLINPPFELVPRGEDWFLHSHGGEDGLDVVRAFLADLPAHLAPGGRLELITWSPGSEKGPELVPLLRAALPAHHLRVDLLDEGPLDDHVAPFAESPLYPGFRARLAERGIDRVHFLYVRASIAEAGPGIEVDTPRARIEACHAVADAWL